MKRRIFAAIMISKELQGKVAQWRENFKKLPVRWISEKNLHITVIAPWYAENIEEIVNTLKEVGKRGSPFELKFHRISYGPHIKKPRLIWAEILPSRNFFNLRDEINRVLKLKLEDAPLRPHLTLARFEPQIFSSFPIKRLDEKIGWTEFAESFSLMESRLGRNGAEYDILCKVKLDSR